MADNVSFGMRTDSEYSSLTSSTTAMSPEGVTRYNCNYSCPRQVYVTSKTREYYESLTSEEREVIKEEYYQSYDYMVGMRTAASLGGTILIFTVFILYKMKCRHGKKQSGSKNVVPDDVEKEGGLSGLLNANKPPNPFSVNNVGSRRSSRVVLTPEDFQFLTRHDRRRLSSIATSTKSDGGRMSCGAIPPFRRGTLTTGDRLPSSYSITSQLPRFVPKEELVSRCKLLTPDLTPEPIDIHIIQPTPNVSPCGSIRRLSEDVGTGCRSKEHTSVSIPLLTLPKCRQSKVKWKARKGGGAGGMASPPCILLAADVDSGDGSSASNANLRPCSSSCGHSPTEMKFIDCSDSDAVSLSSDSDVFSPVESDVGSPPEFVQGFLQCNIQTIEHAQINSNVRESNESISETQC